MESLSDIEYKDEIKQYVRLAHFSIKEFLVSNRIKDGAATSFYVNEDGANIFIAESCLQYHIHISEFEDIRGNPEVRGEIFANFSL